MAGLWWSEGDLLRFGSSPSKVCFLHYSFCWLQTFLTGELSLIIWFLIHFGACMKFLTPPSKPVAFLSSHGGSASRWDQVSLEYWSLPTFQTLKLLITIIIQGNLCTPGPPRTSHWLDYRPVSLEYTLEEGCRGETFQMLHTEKSFLPSCLVNSGWTKNSRLKIISLRTRPALFPGVTEPQFGALFSDSSSVFSDISPYRKSQLLGSVVPLQ